MDKCLHHKARRVLLPFTLIVFFSPIEPLKDLFSYTYFPIVSGSAAFIIFWNFPFLAYMTASRPLYYEDLFIDETKFPNYNIDKSIKQKYQCILLWVLICTNSILLGALSDYWLYKTSKENSVLQIIGITGGIIKIFQIINNTVGRILLKIIKKEIMVEKTLMENREKESIENIVNLKKIESMSNLEIEMTEKHKNRIVSINSPTNIM
jgi:hypothetical protein